MKIPDDGFSGIVGTSWAEDVQMMYGKLKDGKR